MIANVYKVKGILTWMAITECLAVHVLLPVKLLSHAVGTWIFGVVSLKSVTYVDCTTLES